MRRRTYAIHAESFEEYRDISVVRDEKPEIQASPYRPLNLQAEPDQLKIRLDDIKTNKILQDSDQALWKGFDFQVKPFDMDRHDMFEEMSQASTAEENPFSGYASPLLRPSGEFSPPAPIMNSFMMIGTELDKLHTTLNTVFETSVNEEMIPNKGFDLVLKEAEGFGHTYKLKFWLKDPSYERYQDIMRVYYRNIKSYIFVYRPNDRNSFECVAKAIEKIIAKSGKDNFAGMLICDTTSLRSYADIEVHEVEAELLRQTFGLIGRTINGTSMVEVREEILKMATAPVQQENSLKLFSM